MKRLWAFRVGAVVSMVLLVLWMAGCGGGKKVTISVSPTTATLNGGGTQQFSATVSNTSNTAVTWTVSCTAGGAACGSISSSGLYTAPAVVASSTTVTVTATSAADTTKTATATVTLVPISVSVSPSTKSLNGGQTQQFTATVSATTNTAVTWTLSCTAGGVACGSISSSGLYTAPAVVASSATVTVTAKSVADTTKTATATVTLVPISVSVSPATAAMTAASVAQQFTATVSATTNTAVTWSVTCTPSGAACGTITAAGLYTPPSVVVNTTTVTVTATSAADNTKTGTATVTLSPLTITITAPTTATLTATQTHQFAATVTGNADTTVTWTATCTAGGAACGTVSATGLYTAPAVVVNTTTVTVTATSNADNTKTATATVTLNPLIVTVSPGTKTLTAGGTQTFTATVTGNPVQTVTWTVNCTAGGAACGTIDASGNYTAPSVVVSSYDVTVTATSTADNTKSGTATVTLNPLTISVSPSTATLGATMTQQFTATISGNPNTNVTWTATCTAGGAACGTIDAAGLYTAPATVASQSTVTVTATSVADNTKTATATVTLTPVVVTVSPSTASLSVGGTQQFTVNVQGTTNTAVTWTATCGVADCGTVDGSGLYTAPASVASSPLTVTVTATSNADNTKSSSATVTVTSTPVISVALSPNTAQTVNLSGSIVITATVTNDSGSQGVSWGISPSSGCGSLSNSSSTSVTFTAPGSLSSNCTATVTATSIADNSKTATLSITVLQTASLSITTQQSDVSGGGVGVPYGMYFNISGGSTPYTVTVSSGNLPPGLSFSATNPGQLQGTPTTTGTYTFTMQVTDHASATISQSYYIVISAGPDGSHNSYLSGQYACLLNGYVDADGSRWAMLTSVTADGSGNVTAGVFNSNSKAGYGTGTLTGTYSLGGDNRGVLTVTATPGGTFTYAIAANNKNGPTSDTLHLVEFDDVGATPSGQHGDGTCYKQDPTAFNSSTLSGGFAFGMSGESGSGTPRATVGRLSMSAGAITSGEIDQAKGGTYQNANFTGTYGSPDSNGRFTMALVTPGGTANFVSYIIDANRAIMMGADSHATNELESGDVRKQQQGTYAAANINSSFVVYEQSMSVNTSGVIQGYRSQVMQGSCNSSGSCNVNISDADDNGTYRSNDSVGGATATVEASGRVTVTPTGGSAIYFYLYDQNSGFMLDSGSPTDPNVGLGWMEHQTQTSFTLNAFAGTYILDPLPEMQSNNGESSGYVSIDTSGVVTGANDSGGQGYTDYNQQIGATLSVTNATYGQATVSMSGHAGLYCYAISTTKVACIEGSSQHPDVQRLEQ